MRTARKRPAMELPQEWAQSDNQHLQLVHSEMVRLRGELDDTYVLLEGKDNDLQLAAAYGQRLLEDNAELSRRLDKTVAEMNAKIEVSILS